MPFTPQTLSFLFENRIHDSRDWFHAHCDGYRRHILAPLQELTALLTPAMLSIDPMLTTEPRVDRTISRIWRDTRFSRDKALYRDNMWIIFKRGKMHGTGMPGWYFEINQDGFEYGCGFNQASPVFLERMRQSIISGAPTASAALAAYHRQQGFRLEGECYRRPKYPGQPPALREWLERKELCLVQKSNDFPLLFFSQLHTRIETDFLRIAPVYHFLLQTALSLPEQADK